MTYLTITGTLTDKDGKAIDKTHAEWMARQWLTLAKWCGMEFNGAITEARGDDVYRTGVKELPALTKPPLCALPAPGPAPEKPLRIRYRQRQGVSLDTRPHLHVVKSEAAEESALSPNEVFP